MSQPDSGASEPSGRTPQGGSQRAEVRIQLNDTQATRGYANFCHVTATAEEVVLYFGFNTQPVGGTASLSVPIHHREVLNYYAAKRLLAALHVTIQRYEATFGALELDPRKRQLRHDASTAKPPQESGEEPA